MTGQWCVIKYDDYFYPGTIAEVNETHANREDTLWHPQPTPVTRRRAEINKQIWAEMANDKFFERVRGLLW